MLVEGCPPAWRPHTNSYQFSKKLLRQYAKPRQFKIGIRTNSDVLFLFLQSKSCNVLFWKVLRLIANHLQTINPEDLPKSSPGITWCWQCWKLSWKTLTDHEPVQTLKCNRRNVWRFIGSASSIKRCPALCHQNRSLEHGGLVTITAA